MLCSRYISNLWNGNFGQWLAIDPQVALAPGLGLYLVRIIGEQHPNGFFTQVSQPDAVTEIISPGDIGGIGSLQGHDNEYLYTPK